jgi:hypothetical protein
VVLADGLYTGAGNRDIDFAGKAITVRSLNGPFACVIDCQNAGRGFRFAAGEGPKSRVQGLTVLHGYATNGGAITCEGGASPTILGCILAASTATSGGGAVYVNGGHPVLRDCLVGLNSSLYGGGVSLVDSDGAMIQSCTFAANSAGLWGGAIVSLGFEVTIEGSILWSNSAPSGPELYLLAGTATVAYCDIQGGQPAVSVSFLAALQWGTGNLESAPGFANPSLGDFHLLQGSPCIDAGDPLFMSIPLEVDLDGQPRVRNGRVDMGADESAGP